MKIFTEAEARALLEKVVKLSVADECNASLSGSVAGNIRFALNNVSTSGIVSDTSLAVQVAFGKRTGVATINEFDDASLERVVRRAEDLARLAPENEEYMPALGKQTYMPTPTYAQSTADITPEYRAQVAADSIGPCKADKLVAAGFLADSAGFTAFANSKGNFGYQTVHRHQLHLHRAHRRRPRLGLGDQQLRGRRTSSTPRTTSRSRSRRPRVRPTPRRWSRASTR